jgi:hypothetical protein
MSLRKSSFVFFFCGGGVDCASDDDALTSSLEELDTMADGEMMTDDLDEPNEWRAPPVCSDGPRFVKLVLHAERAGRVGNGPRGDGGGERLGIGGAPGDAGSCTGASSAERLSSCVK